MQSRDDPLKDAEEGRRAPGKVKPLVVRESPGLQGERAEKLEQTKICLLGAGHPLPVTAA